ncbi:MAG: hypothetical protein H0X42_10460 [Solirubrobacterales bacterium]|nr:hypothetical protein [Solirubrobacterales bacterium]
MLKRLIAAAICTAVACGLVLNSAAAAGSGVQVSKGRTAQGRQIRIAFHPRSVELKHFTIRLRCKGGDVLIDAESGFLPSKVLKNGRIRDHQVGSTDDVYLRGRLGNHRLHGAIRVRDRLGKHRCDSKWVRFHVQR